MLCQLRCVLGIKAPSKSVKTKISVNSIWKPCSTPPETGPSQHSPSSTNLWPFHPEKLDPVAELTLYTMHLPGPDKSIVHLPGPSPNLGWANDFLFHLPRKCIEFIRNIVSKLFSRCCRLSGKWLKLEFVRPWSTVCRVTSGAQTCQKPC